MNKCHIHIKQNSKPSIHFKKIVLTYHWSLAINKLQKIFALRCKQPLEKIKNQVLQIKQSRSEQNSQIFKNKQSNKHVRYLSQQTQQVETYSQLDFDLISERSDDPEQSQRNNHTQNKSQNLDIAKIENQQSELKQSAYFNSQNSLDQLKFNEEFLDLFNKQKGLSQFGQLCIICILFSSKVKIKSKNKRCQFRRQLKAGQANPIQIYIYFFLQ
ncbi:unnamed protein product (macronuclear) [Paramecium tetraurelia]|uniref:Transmembrane protein n=1 Tax=Paramecium tetraurelia TaxID=5888 RepID=A0D2A9_PARTE|nr:uncharacterized protein GSPATT00012682001 [Paramecium tetraurelia]CAK77176.1 unnamed protein product [Paramecium tetraurelia]|eukprot:XP_001444573.1 hypothetical protein (macronuclear) [Paramecium tetraurelia strain d4-2]